MPNFVELITLDELTLMANYGRESPPAKLMSWDANF